MWTSSLRWQCRKISSFFTRQKCLILIISPLLPLSKICASHIIREPVNKNEQFNEYLFDILKGTVVNRAKPSLNGGSLKLRLQVLAKFISRLLISLYFWIIMNESWIQNNQDYGIERGKSSFSKLIKLWWENCDIWQHWQVVYINKQGSIQIYKIYL